MTRSQGAAPIKCDNSMCFLENGTWLAGDPAPRRRLSLCAAGAKKFGFMDPETRDLAYFRAAFLSRTRLRTARIVYSFSRAVKPNIYVHVRSAVPRPRSQRLHRMLIGVRSSRAGLEDEARTASSCSSAGRLTRLCARHRHHRRHRRHHHRSKQLCAGARLARQLRCRLIARRRQRKFRTDTVPAAVVRSQSSASL